MYKRHQDLVAYLEGAGARYRLLAHQPCRTSAESAEARSSQGEGAAVGAKALVVKLERDKSFCLLVLPGPAKLDNKAARRALGDFRFATIEELADVTGGLVPGSVPPFGAPYLPGVAQVFVDGRITDHSIVGFNAAALDRSVVMNTDEYLRVLGPHEQLQ